MPLPLPLLLRLREAPAERPSDDDDGPLARALRLALLTRPGESAADPELGTPGHAELVHGDRGPVIALQSQLRAALRRLCPGSERPRIAIEIDPTRASIEIAAVAPPSSPHAQSPSASASATIDARGLVRLNDPRRRRP